ncbi:hypothetical protein FGADI_11642 [Fusarium gaditjirri]|uniref:Uncharacterized protein n=1 Tax=Fusarium gaditjirri TaxID=282569 RepID=A0A8H4SU24_9HYPO|nr:hypothetical protein FGADI_11642 [Fusarium gaditjirri]
MDLEFEDHEFFDSDSESDDSETEYFKANSGFSPSCGLCRFDFRTDDSVVVFNEKCEPWTTTYSKPEISWTVAYSKHTFHAECVELAQPDLMSGQRLDPGIYDATFLEPLREGQYPLPAFETRRLNWLKKTFSENLFQAINYRLPREVCDNIAQYCLRDRAVQVVRDLWLRKDRPKPGRISMEIKQGNSLWAQYVYYEGIRHVRSLSYHSVGGDETQIFQDRQGNVNIFVLHDYLGVVDIIATSNSEIPPSKEQTGRWWTLFTPNKEPFYLKARFDGIKLRELAAYKYADDRPRYPPDLRWSVLPTTLDPIPEPPIPCSNTLLDGEIIWAIDWNQPDVIGYSFYLWDNTVMKIISHKVGEKRPYNFSTNVQYRFSWVYFPVDADERISEIWIRRYAVKLVEELCSPMATILLRTSKGRLLTLGPQLKYRQPLGYKTHAKYDLVGTLPQTYPCRMYFANWYDSGSWMRFEGASTFAKLNLGGCYNKELELLPDDCKYQYSSAELDGVRTVTPCGSWRDYRPDAILGLLLTYEDGRQRCVGQVRLDFLLDPIEVTSEAMWICYPETDELSWCANKEDDESGVDLISFEGPDELEEPYIKIPMRGCLDWYFSERQCHLSHRDDSEPLDEFLEVLSQEAAPGMPRQGHVVKPFSVLVGREVDRMESWKFERRQ